MKIKVKLKDLSISSITLIKKGDWIDLRSGETYEFTKKGEFKYINLGIAMQLPKGYEAIVVARSSTYKNFKIFNPNAFGVIDNSYQGDDDYWKFPAYSLGKTIVNKGDRICQFRIQLSQKATIWQKIKWLFVNNIKIEHVNKLNSKNRNGLGSSGIK